MAEAGLLFRDEAALGMVPVPFLQSSLDPGGFTPGMYRFDVILQLPKEDFIQGMYKGRMPVLVFPRLGGNSLGVRFNGELVGRWGEPVQGAASIWNAVHIVSLDPGNVRYRNVVSVEIRGVYEVGLPVSPFLVDAAIVPLGLFLFSYLTGAGVWVLIGITFTVGAILLATGLMARKGFDERVLSGAACLFVALILLDYAQIERLPLSLLVFKRVVSAARHIAAVFTLLAGLAITRRRAEPFAISFILVQILVAATLFLAPVDMAGLKRIYSIGYFAIFPLLPYLVILFLRRTDADPSRLILVVGAAFALVSSLMDTLTVSFRTGFPYIAHYGLSALIICVAVFVVSDIFQQYRALAAERIRSAMFMEESLRDALTGAFNRVVLEPIAEGLHGIYSVVFVDVDDFKQVNDTYGHAVGDQVLRSVADIIRNQLRTKDHVVRLGGDEFVAVLPDCPEEKAEELARRIVAAAPNLKISGLSGCSVSAGVAKGAGNDAGELFTTISRADEAVYLAKGAGKGRVGVYRR